MTDPFAPQPGQHPIPQPQPHAPDAPQPAQPTPPAQRSTTRITIWIVAGLVVLAALIAGGFAIWTSATRGPSAQETAEQYLQHIADGEATAASALAAPQHDEVAAMSDPSLLTDEVLGAAVERISEIVVEPSTGSDGSGDYASFDVSYVLAGERYDTTIALERTDGEGLAPGTWQVRTELTDRFIVVSGSPAFLLGGAEMPTVGSDEFLPMALYPAVYPIAAIDDTFFRTDRDELVIPGVPASVDSVALVPNEHFSTELQKQVDAFLDECATQTTWRPEGCPMSAPLDARTVAVEWSIDTYPTVEILLDGEMFRADGGTVRAVYTSEGAAEPVTVEDDLTAGGTIEIDGSKLVLSFG